MSPELDKQLCEKYPKIFKNRYNDPKDSCIAFGIECGNGWYKIIDMLCMAATYTYSTSVSIDEEDGIRLGVQPFTLKNVSTPHYSFGIESPQIVADQVKEKFGTLRFYYHLEFDPKLVELNKSGKYPEIKEIMNRYSDYFDGIIHMAETMSSMICEETGKEGEMHVSNGGRNGWYKTLNREYAKTEEFYVDRKYIPYKDVPKQESDEIE